MPPSLSGTPRSQHESIAVSEVILCDGETLKTSARKKSLQKHPYRILVVLGILSSLNLYCIKLQDETLLNHLFMLLNYSIYDEILFYFFCKGISFYLIGTF